MLFGTLNFFTSIHRVVHRSVFLMVSDCVNYFIAIDLLAGFIVTSFFRFVFFQVFSLSVVNPYSLNDIAILTVQEEVYHLSTNVFLSSTTLTAVMYPSPHLFGIPGSFFHFVEFTSVDRVSFELSTHVLASLDVIQLDHSLMYSHFEIVVIAAGV